MWNILIWIIVIFYGITLISIMIESFQLLFKDEDDTISNDTTDSNNVTTDNECDF